jgi:hypothetical protein
MTFTTIKNSVVFGIVAVMMVLGTSAANADRLTHSGYSPLDGYRYNFTFQNAQNETETWTETAEEIHGTNLTTGQDLQFFCTGYYTYTSSAFASATGQKYTASSLADSPLSDVQQYAIQTLFDHTYSSLLDAQEIYATATESKQSAAQKQVALMTMAIQYSVWEIVHEVSDTNDWDILTGQFKVSNIENASYTAKNMLTQVANLSSSWFASIDSGFWADPYATATPWEITYFNAGTVSQPFVSVTGVRESTSTPEPATLLVMGLGLAGAACMRRRRK